MKYYQEKHKYCASLLLVGLVGQTELARRMLDVGHKVWNGVRAAGLGFTKHRFNGIIVPNTIEFLLHNKMRA